MSFDETLLSIIDTPEFQRLKNIKQLGICYYVFPGASHNRFEHSLGVSHLCGLMIKHLQEAQPELNITDRDVLIVRIAGLVHDIGHACFSHFFDHLFLKKKLKNNPAVDHEYRSCILFDHIVKKYDIQISEYECDMVKRLIDPKKDDISFIFQIVANKNNGLDCDKFDYIARDTYNVGLSYSFDCSRLILQSRVIDDIISFPAKCHHDITDLYYTRYKLHKQIYTHHAVRSIEYMILDVLDIAEEKLHLTDYVLDMDKFKYLTDNILDIIEFNNIESATIILNNIKRRNNYILVKEGKIDNIDLTNIKKVIDDNCLNESIIIDSIKLNYSMGKKNPMDYVKLYSSSGVIVTTDKITGLLPNIFEEKIIRIYSKKEDLIKFFT